MPFNEKRSFCGKMNVSNKMNTQKYDCKEEPDIIFKFKESVSVRNPNAYFTSNILANQDLEPMPTDGSLALRPLLSVFARASTQHRTVCEL